MKIFGQDSALKAANLLIVLPLSAYWLFGAKGGPPLWLISLCASIGTAYLVLTLIPGNALRVNLLPRYRAQWRLFAQRRRTFGLMAGLWFFGHYNLAVTMLREEIGGPDQIQQRYDRVLDNGQIATFIFLILFVTSYTWSMRILKAHWRRLHGLAWFVVPLILVHSVSAKKAFEGEWPTLTLVMLLAIVGFAVFEFRTLAERKHMDRWRHILLLLAGGLVALFYRFFYR